MVFLVCSEEVVATFSSIKVGSGQLQETALNLKLLAFSTMTKILQMLSETESKVRGQRSDSAHRGRSFYCPGKSGPCECFKVLAQLSTFFFVFCRLPTESVFVILSRRSY